MRTRKFIFVFLQCITLTLAGVSFNAVASCSPVKGINLAGPEFSPQVLPGRVNWHYKFPTTSQLEYYKGNGFEAIRLPILWERVQPDLFSALDKTYLSEINEFLAKAHNAKLVVLLEIHNYARYRGEVIGSDSVPKSAFYDVWRKLSAAVMHQPALTAYGLMNEPYNTGGLWAKVAQAGVSGIRRVDSSRHIYVSGDGFSGTGRWPTLHPVPFVHDPAGKEIYDGHIYFDVDASGKYLNPKPYTSPSKAVAPLLSPFINWLKVHGKNGAITEWGVPSRDKDWFDTAKVFLQMASENCLPTYVWAGGGWSPNYVMSLEPYEGKDKPLLEFLRDFNHVEAP